MTIAPVTLEGSHVRLEPLGHLHHEGLCEVGLDQDLWRLIPSRITTPEEMTKSIGGMLADQVKGVTLPFVTVDVSSGKVIGSTRYMNIDEVNRRVEIGGTWIAKPWQRTAINTEAKYLMLRHAFEVFGCVRVELKTDALNSQSRNAILRIGAKEEGTLRQHVLTWSGRWRDTVYFSVIEAEWPVVKANLEKRMLRP